MQDEKIVSIIFNESERFRRVDFFTAMPFPSGKNSAKAALSHYRLKKNNSHTNFFSHCIYIAGEKLKNLSWITVLAVEQPFVFFLFLPATILQRTFYSKIERKIIF